MVSYIRYNSNSGSPGINMKVLISSRSFGKINSGAIELLENSGLEVIMNPYGRKLSEEEIIKLMDDSVGVIAGTEVFTKNVLENSDNLKVISRYGVGLDNVDLTSATQKEIKVFNTPVTPSLAVAELAMSIIFNLLKKIQIVSTRLKNDMWKPEVGNLLTGKTIGIIGLGRIGKKLVEFLKPYNCRIVAYEINPDKEFISKNNVETLDLNSLLKTSDIISIHCPISDETRNMIGKNEFDLMKNNAIIINTARGGIIDEDALYEALKNNKIGAAGIDAFEKEPYEGKLKELDNILLTPHIGTFNVETRKDMEVEAAENLIKGLKEVKIL